MYRTEVQKHKVEIAMKVFQTYLGIVDYAFAHDGELDESTSSGRLRKRLSAYKNPIVCTIIACGCIFVACFVCFDVKTFLEFSEAVYTFLTLGVSVVFTRIFHVNKQLIFEFIENFDNVIKARE